MNNDIIWISSIMTNEEERPVRVSGNIRNNPSRELGQACYQLYNNPLLDTKFLILEYLNADNTILSPTVVISKDILEDDEILDALRIKASNITVRIADEGYVLTQEDYDKLSFADMIVVDSCEEELVNDSKIVLQNNIFKLESQAAQPVIERRNTFSEMVARITFHINHKLTEEEFAALAQNLNNIDNSAIELDYFDPSYYQEFLEGLERHHVRDNINIQLIGYLLKDQLDTYENLTKYPYEIDVVYSTCHDVVERYTREPYTQNRLYYSQIEGGGKTSLQNYLNVLNELVEFETMVKRDNLSPLEIAIAAKMKIDEEYIYDPDVDNVDDWWDNINLSQMINHEVDGKKRAVCMGFSTLYSALLRRNNVPMFRYSTTEHSRNIGRICDEKYGVDTVCVSDVTWDLQSGNENQPSFDHFMIAPREFLKLKYKEYMTIANVLSLPIDEYLNKYQEASDPVEEFYHPLFYRPDGYTVRMLELMELIQHDGQRVDLYDNIYRLCSEKKLESIPTDTIINALDNVLSIRGISKDEIESYKQIVTSDLATRNTIYAHEPALLLTDSSDTIPVELLTQENVREYQELLEQLDERTRIILYSNHPDEGEPELEPAPEEHIEQTPLNDMLNDNNNQSAEEVTVSEPTVEGEHIEQTPFNDMLTDSINNQSNVTERIHLYRDTINNEFYILKTNLSRFSKTATSEEVKINNRYCCRISREDALDIIRNQDNDISPYEVVIEETDKIEKIDSNTIAKENYIINLLQYIEENNISIFHYYLELANNYRQNPNYQPLEFEQNNPFIITNDLTLLRQSKEKYISLYFARSLAKVIELNKPKFILANQEELFSNIEEDVQREFHHR